MGKTDKKKKPLIVLSIILVGMLSISIWQSMAESPRDALSESENGQILKNLRPEEADTLIKEHKDDENFVILDVRTPGEFSSGHIENAINIDFYGKSFREKLNTLDKDKTYLVYCRSGNRSGKTLSMMKELKFNHVYNMIYGISGWAAKKLPITR